MRSLLCLLSTAILKCLWVLSFALPLQAQLFIENGEKVKVPYEKTLVEGVILGYEKGRYGVAFKVDNQQKRALYERSQIRIVCEFDSIDFARVWESKNSKSKIVAALKKIGEDNVTITKRDGTDLEVKLSSLSPKDVEYVDSIRNRKHNAIEKGDVPAPVPELPPLDVFENAVEPLENEADFKGELKTLAALPSFYKTFRESGLGFWFTRVRQQVVALIPVGGPEQLVLLTAREDNASNGDLPFQSQAYWVSLKDQKVLGSVPLTPDDYILDYDPRSKLLLSIHLDDVFKISDGVRSWITVWRLNPGATTAEPIVRWEANYFSHFFGSQFAKILSKDLVLTKTSKNTYVAWNIHEKIAVYSVTSKSFFDSLVVVSPDLKTLFVPDEKCVRVIDSATGQPRFTLQVNDSSVGGVGINSNGTRLAALTGNQIFVWDLASNNPTPKAYDAPLVGSPWTSRIEWIDDDNLLVDGTSGRVLYCLSLQLPVWSYQMHSSAKNLNKSTLTNRVVNGLFFYVAEPPDKKGSVAVGAVQLPGPQVKEILAGVERPSLLILKPGSAVGIKLHNVDHPGQVEEWLKEKIRINRWIYDQSAPIQLHATMGSGESKSITFRNSNDPTKKTTVPFTSRFARLEIKKGATVLWQSEMFTRLPDAMTSRNFREEIARAEYPPFGFYSGVQLPAEMIDPNYSRGFGVSHLGLRGIEVTSTKPPGREDDPYATERKNQSDKEQGALERNR